MNIEDLTSKIELTELNFPYSGSWSASISAFNLETEHEYFLYTVQTTAGNNYREIHQTGLNEFIAYSHRIDRVIEAESVIYPIPEEIVLSKYKVNLNYRDEKSVFHTTTNNFLLKRQQRFSTMIILILRSRVNQQALKQLSMTKATFFK